MRGIGEKLFALAEGGFEAGEQIVEAQTHGLKFRGQAVDGDAAVEIVVFADCVRSARPWSASAGVESGAGDDHGDARGGQPREQAKAAERKEQPPQQGIETDPPGRNRTP